MQKLAIIANGRAGSQKAWQEAIHARRTVWGRRCEFFLPRSLDELRALVADLESPPRSGSYDGLVVIGGDGTQHQVIRSFRKFPNEIPLYAFPGGTANDLARELGLERDWEQASRLLDARRPELMDLIEVNGIPFATVAGTGIGALLTREFNARRARSSAFRWLARGLHSQVYTAMSLKTILLQRDYLQRVHVRAPGFEEKLETSAIFVCNQTHLGGNLRVAPSSHSDDNRFNVMIIPKLGRLQLTMVLTQLKLGRLPKEFVIFSTDRLSVTETRGKPVTVFGDGETLVSDSKLDFRVKPMSLRVFKDSRRKESRE